MLVVAIVCRWIQIPFLRLLCPLLGYLLFLKFCRPLLGQIEKHCFNMEGHLVWGSTASRLELLRGGSLLFATQFPEIPGTHFIDLRRMKV